MFLHPDALFAEPYEEHRLGTASYRKPQGPLTRQCVSDHRLELRDGDSCSLRIEGVADWGLRIRSSASAIATESVTERLGLLDVPADAGSAAPADGLLFRGASLCCEVDAESCGWTVKRTDGTPLLATHGGIRFGDEPGEYSGERVLAAFDFPADEEVYGFGGRIAPLCRRGQTVDVFAVKVGRSSGDYGGFPLPFFISTRGYGFFLNNPWPHVYFDMGATVPEQWWLHAPGGAFDVIVIDGPRIPDIVKRFTGLVGRIPEPERWWLGFWTSALAFSTADEVETVGKRLRKERYPCDALVIDGPWRGGPEFLEKYMSDGEYPTNDLNWHPDFGDGPGMLNRLGRQGLKIVLHQNSRSWLKETVERGVEAGTIRQEGREAVVTFGTGAGERFYHEAIRPRHKEGVALWWLDHGDRVSGELLPGIPSRNLYGAMWARSTRRCGEEDGVGSRLALIRGAGIGGQHAALPWPGDTRFGIDFFLDDVRFCMNAGLSGFPLASADLGGFMSAREDDPPYNTAFDEDNLARRLCQAMLVIPVPRMHQCDSEPPKLPWNCPEHIQVLYRRMLEERYRLTPYYYSYAVHASRTGEPIIRPLVYRYQDDPAARAIENQCLIGDWLMAAPVFEKDARERKVFLPDGEWTCWWTGTQYGGSQWITVEAPLCEPRGLPLFVRVGAIIPTQAPVGHLGSEPPASLTLDVYPSASSEWAMEEGAERRTVFSCRRSSGIDLGVDRSPGPARHFRVRLHNVDPGTPVRVNGREIAHQPAMEVTV